MALRSHSGDRGALSFGVRARIPGCFLHETTMTEPGRPDPPQHLGKAGRKLWRQIISALEDDWQLDGRELALLARACRCADEVAQLEEAIDREGVTTTGSRKQTVIHPAIQEARQLRLTELRLLSAIELTDPRAQGITSQRARHAAEARWGKRPKLAAAN